MELNFRIEELPEVAKKFIDAIGQDTIFLFTADMGAGKTTFISEVCRQLGVTDHMGSPTFSLVNEYRDAHGKPVYHFDLYRIDNPEEILNMGAEDYFYSGDLCFVEWPDRLGPLTPPESRIVSISVNPDGSRSIVF